MTDTTDAAASTVARSEVGLPGPVRLWPQQETAVKAVTAQVAGGGRAQVVMACGTGKTMVGAMAAADVVDVADAGRVLVVVPTLELLAQTATVYASTMPAGSIAAVCSDFVSPAVASQTRHMLERIHAGVSTDPEQIAAWMSAPGRLTVLATYQSLAAIAAAHQDFAAPAWDLIVIDEAHRSAGRRDRAWDIVHRNAAIPASRRLYMTATPRVMSSEQFETTSMDDPAVFGPEVYRLSFAEAIDADLLADYRVVVAVVTDEDVARLTAQNSHSIVTIDGRAVPARLAATQIALLKAARQWDLHRIITYHHRILTAERFASTLLNTADKLPAAERPQVIHADWVSGDMSMNRRRDVLNALHDPGNRTVVVSNARVLAEGVDVPELDAVMFADPRDSTTDVVQAVGRALRRGRHSSKTATIIVPVMLHTAEAPESGLETSEYATVWRVIRALRAHDERLADWLDDQRVRLTTEDEHRTRIGAHPLPNWLHVTGAPVTETFVSALTVRMITATTSAWLDGFAAATMHVTHHGHLDVPTDYRTENGYPLGKWLAHRRHERRRGHLTADRIAQLDALGMLWEPVDTAWHRRFTAARKEHAATGKWPQHWLASQRAKYRNGKLSPTKLRALTNAGVPLEPNAVTPWQRGVEHARTYHAEHNTLNVPKTYTCTDGYALGAWLNTQRVRRRKGQLTSDEIAELDALGMVWDPKKQRWQDGLAAAHRYRELHGHLNVPDGYVDETGYALGKWIAWLRARRRGTKNGQSISAQQIAELDKLGMHWSRPPRSATKARSVDP